MMKNERIVNRKTLVDVLTMLFGLGTWIGVNGIFVQIPLIIKTAPESWSLPSYMVIAIQLGNLGPLTYGIYRKFCTKYLNDVYWISTLLFIGLTSLVLMIFFYNHHTLIGDKLHSIAFLSLVFINSLLGCSGPVVFYPYMRNFKEIYFTSYFVGEGLGSFIPSSFALFQGVGGNPDCVKVVDAAGNTTIVPMFPKPSFGTPIFFAVISLLSLISFCSYVLLVNLNTCKSERVSIDVEIAKPVEYEMISVDDHDRRQSAFDTTVNVINPSRVQLLVFLTLIATTMGILPSIGSYSCLPYGNLAYHLVATLASMANPVACFLAVFVPCTSKRILSVLISICAILCSYLITTSVLSPNPPLVNTDIGVAIVVLSWIATMGLTSYVKLSILTIFRSIGGSWMFYCGTLTQLGAVTGSILSFVLINYTDIFVSIKYCT